MANVKLGSTVAEVIGAINVNYNESIIALSVDGATVEYMKGDGTKGSFKTEANTQYGLHTDTNGLSKIYAITTAEDGTTTRIEDALAAQINKKVEVSINGSTLIFSNNNNSIT